MSVGGQGIRRPSAPAVSDSHAYRLDSLERKRPDNARPERVQSEILFCYSGGLQASLSQRYYPRHSGRLTAVFFSLGTAGSTATTFKVYKAGAALTPVSVDSNMTIVSTTTLSLTGSNNTGLVQFDALFSKDSDYLQVQIVSVGSSAAGLDAQARFG